MYNIHYNPSNVKINLKINELCTFRVNLKMKSKNFLKELIAAK